MKINCKTLNRTVFFAAEELKKYLMMMQPSVGDVPIEYTDGDGFRLGLMSDFDIHIPEEHDPLYDDVLYIDTTSRGGIIAGNNIRSVLLAVYEFLHQNGCRWLFPGKDGEYIPRRELVPVKYVNKAYLRFRGLAPESGSSRENVLDFIDFAPKVGMNLFMTEFDTLYIYHQCWYKHGANKNKPCEDITEEIALSWKREFQSEISKRSLMYHDVGHGWTCAPFGIPLNEGASFNQIQFETTPEIKRHLAMIDGKRDYFGGRAINTNLCMSNTETRKTVAKSVADYAEKNRNVDFLHVWLADDVNNHCECEECKKNIPTDWYVMLLNDIDKELVQRGLDTKIVFILYYELYWAPICERLNNPDRFCLLFAPITRLYTDDYSTETSESEIKPFVLNNIPRIASMKENLAYLKKWRDVFSGNGMTFEYHFHWLQYRDMGGFNIAKSVFDDVRSLKKATLDGMIENMSLRSAFPSGFAVYTWARSMFDGEISFEEITQEYFRCAFGEDYRSALDYLKKMSNCYDFTYMTRAARDGNVLDKALKPMMDEAIEITKEFKSIVDTGFKNGERCENTSWLILKRFCDFAILLSGALALAAEGKYEAGKQKWLEAIDNIAEHEDEIQKYFNLDLYSIVTESMFNGGQLQETMQ